MNHQNGSESRYMKLTFWVVILMSVAVIALLGLQIVDTHNQAERATEQAKENAILIETNYQLIEDVADLVEQAKIQRTIQTNTILCVLQYPSEQRSDAVVDNCRTEAAALP